MLLANLSSAVLRLTAIVVILAVPALAQAKNGSTDGHVQSTFVSPAGDLAFSVTIPSDSDTDLYFTLAAPAEVGWVAVGLGSDTMRGALVLMAYLSSSENAVTFSPRLATGHNEPTFYPDLKVESLNGTGLFDGIYHFSGRCRNCRSWPGGGRLDVKSSAQKCIFANGPGGLVGSDRPDAPLRYHSGYGSFTIDLAAATGPAGVPTIPTDPDDVGSGATLGTTKSGKRDWASLAHAVIMVGTFVGVMPMGVLVLRLGGWVRWHGVNQGVALVGVITGAGLGIYISTLYNRSKSFRNPHQIIGLIVFIFVIAQFALGYFHHHTYKRTQQPTRLAPIHVWLGRLVMFLGILNGFLGFAFALAPRYNYILAGLVIAVVPIVAALIFGKDLIRKRLARSAAQQEEAPPGYDAEPWRAQESWGQSGPPQGGPQAGADTQGIGLSDLNAHGSAKKERWGRRKERGETRGLGTEQRPSEYV